MYNVDLQTNYRNVSYNWKGGSGKTIYTSGCCPSSVRNILVNLCGTKTSITAMCALARECGARVNGGTVAVTLLAAAQKRYGGFTYSYTISDRKAREHVAAGGMALCHTTGANKIFSTAGHFVAMVAANQNTVTIIDPYITAKKWRLYSRPDRVTPTAQKGVVKVSRATSDNSFDYYYLISKNKPHSDGRKAEDDMTEKEVRAIIEKVAEEKAKQAVSAWAKQAWDAATDAGIVDGTRPHSALTRQEAAQILKNCGLIGTGRGGVFRESHKNEGE